MISRYRKVSHSWAALSDSRNCSVIALSIVCRVPYNVAQDACKAMGRKKGHGMSTPAVLSTAKRLGCEVDKVTNRNGKPLRQKNGSRYTCKTVGQRCKAGYYLVFVRAHVLAVVNGKIEDWSSNRNNRVLSVWRVTVPKGSRS